MRQGKQFHLANVLSITTGYLFPEPGTKYPIDGVYNILNYMTGDNLYTHQLGRAMEECKPLLLEQLPFTQQINVTHMDGEKDLTKWNALLDELVAQHGAFHTVYPLGADDHAVIDPIEELTNMVGADRVIPVVLDDTDEPDAAGDINWKVD